MSFLLALQHIAVATLHQAGPHAAAATSAGVAARAATASRASSAARASRASGATRASRAARASRANRASRGGVRRTTTSSAKGKAGGKPRTKKLEFKRRKMATDATRWGDTSFTFRAPGLALSDSLSLSAPVWLARFSPLASAFSLDGAYLRATMGSLTWLAPVVAGVGGLGAGIATQGLTKPLPLAVFTIMLVAGLCDALTGLAATVGLLAAMVVTGTFFTVNGFTSLVLLGALWCGLSVMISKIRPFIKLVPQSPAEWYQRVGDVVVGSLIAGYLAKEFVQILSGPHDSLVAIHESDVHLGWLVVGLTAGRYLLSTLVCFLYPQRVAGVLPTNFPTRSTRAHQVSLVARAVAAFVVFSAFLGSNWMVVSLLVLYMIDVIVPDLVPAASGYSEWRVLIPQNLGKILVLTLASVVSVIALRSTVTSSYNLVIASLLIVMAVAIVINVLSARWNPDAPRHPAVAYVGGFALAGLTLLQLTNHLVHA